MIVIGKTVALRSPLGLPLIEAIARCR